MYYLDRRDFICNCVCSLWSSTLLWSVIPAMEQHCYTASSRWNSSFFLEVKLFFAATAPLAFQFQVSFLCLDQRPDDQRKGYWLVGGPQEVRERDLTVGNVWTIYRESTHPSWGVYIPASFRLTQPVLSEGLYFSTIVPNCSLINESN